MMTKSKSKFLIPAVGATIVVAGGISTYVYLNSFGSDSPLEVAKLIPSNTLMVTYFNTDPQLWNKLGKFGTSQARQIVTQRLQSVNQSVFENNISYEKDIQPWIGGVTLAVLPSNPNGNLSLSAPNLLVVGIKDKFGALNFANKLRQQKTLKTEESNYKGEKIISNNNKGKSSYLCLLNNTYILLSDQKETVEKAIDTFKGQPSFASAEASKSILTQTVDLQNSLGQVYVPDYGRMIKELSASSPNRESLQPRILEQIKRVKSLVAKVGIDDSGLRFKAVVNLDPKLNTVEYQSSSSKILELIPEDTIGLVTGKNINRTWLSFLDESKNDPQIWQGIQQVKQQFQNNANIDLNKDIFSWMDGEFAWSAVKSNQGILANSGFGIAMVFDTSDRPTAETTLNKLDDLARKQSLTVAQRNINNKNITEWGVPGGGILFTHGWSDQDTVFMAVGGPVGEKLADNKGKTIDKSNNFKSVISSLGKPNGGYFYLDMDKTIPIINSISGQPLPPDANAILSSVRGFGMTFHNPNQSTTQLEMLLGLKPSR